MENLASDIPIYKIFHIRSPAVVRPREETDPAASAASASQLSPIYNVMYVFYGAV